MDYGNLFRRAWDIVWNNKFMFILGFIAALSGGGGNGGGGGNTGFSGNASDFGFDSNSAANFFNRIEQYIPLFIGLFCLLIFVALLFWILSAIAKAGMIDAASRIDAGEKSSFRLAWSAGRSKLGRMLGLDIVLFGIIFVLGLIAAIVGFSTFITLFTGAAAGDFNPDNFDAFGSSLGIFGICMACLACLLIPYGIVATVVQPFAQRAIVLEGYGVVDSIKRGWQVLRQNLGDVLLLILFFIVIGIVFGLVSLVVLLPFAALTLGPGIFRIITTETFDMLNIGLLIAGGIILGLVGAVVNSIMIAFRSTAVTLAYQEFTDKKDVV